MYIQKTFAIFLGPIGSVQPWYPYFPLLGKWDIMSLEQIWDDGEVHKKDKVYMICFKEIFNEIRKNIRIPVYV